LPNWKPSILVLVLEFTAEESSPPNIHVELKSIDRPGC
jgi:hypothetical protein